MKLPGASSRQLSDFALDIVFELEQTQLFSKIKTRKAGSPNCGLLIQCALADPLTAPERATQALQEVWDATRFGGDEKRNQHRITRVNGKIQLEFRTATDDARFTGRIEVAALGRESEAR